jgi:hypothetical protein
MTQAQIHEAEVRALAGQIIGHLRTISESSTTLRRRNVRELVLLVERDLQQLAKLADQLP